MANRPDRLAQLRANQQDGRSGNGGNSDATGRANPYARQDGGSYEMTAQPSSYATRQQSYAPADSSGDDTSNIQDDIKHYNENVNAISDLQSRSLNSADESVARRNAEQLEQLVAEQSQLSTALKRRIQDLERHGSAPGNKQQTAFVKSKFVEAIQNYQQVEQQSRAKYKQRVERQFKIVKPDASPEEVRAVVNDESGGQIFSQALMNSNRYGESRAAYRDVQERQEDIKKIEKTLTELAQLFQEMSVLVEQQDEPLDAIRGDAEDTDKLVRMGYQDTEKAVVSARGARKKRWICLGITVVIIIVVVLVVVLKLRPWDNKK
ncbi:t-SNARE [Auricularia subglabra TFB-10046 SS5]|uniref:t-SNARE n=1 Tax=Auricularia subglabra (strain TFB-10046 / SS5) TaxID=717982 RepID=J0D933_AURST|nr:t-SNARE [Auricularia subglabra TFB-10046 SS5]